MVHIVKLRMKKGLKSTRDLNCGDHCQSLFKDVFLFAYERCSDKVFGIDLLLWVKYRDITQYSNQLIIGSGSRIGFKESGPKWTVQKGESGRSLKWTVARKWTVCPKVDGLKPNRTVI